MANSTTREALGWWLALAALAYLTYLIVRPFWEAIIWAIILASVTWPIYRPLRGLFGKNALGSSLVMGTLVTAAVIVPLALLLSALVKEVRPAYESAMALVASAPPPPTWMQRVPGLSEVWNDAISVLHGTSSAGHEWIRPLLQPGAKALAFVGDSLFQGVLALFTLYFLYFFGDTYLAQGKAAMRNLIGDRFDRLFGPTKEALRSVFAGVILAAAAQGLVAGVGYAIAGLEAPIILGIATGVLALIPFGAVLVWGTSAIGLFAVGSTWQGIVILLWGMFLVSWVDNLVRPLVISGGARLPYLQTFFSLIGGLAAFGLVGLFIGPAILAVWMVVWAEWVEEVAPPPVPISNQV